MEIPRCVPVGAHGIPPPIIHGGIPNQFDPFKCSASRYLCPPTFSPTSSSLPVTIPESGRVEDDLAPPPLPPPRFPIDGPGKHLDGPRRHLRHFSGDSWTGLSGHGCLGNSLEADRFDHMRRAADKMKVDRDEGYHSLASTLSATQESLPRPFMSHTQYQFRPSGPSDNDYDTSLLKKFDARRTLENRSPPRRPPLSSSTSDCISQYLSSDRRHPPTLVPLSLPMPPAKPFLESPGRYTDTPPQSAVSSRYSPVYGAGGRDYRSPVDATEADQSPFSRSRRTTSSSVPDRLTVSTRGSRDNIGDDIDSPMVDAFGFKRMHIDEQRPDYQVAGQKRRAFSGPGDEGPSLQSLPLSGDLPRRREGGFRASSTPRLTVIPQGSNPSISSAARSNSFVSNVSYAATNGTNMVSFGTASSGGLSPAVLSPVEAVGSSPYMPPRAAGLSHVSPGRASHQRNLSDGRSLISPRKVCDVPKNPLSLTHGFYMCDCCPKKPKKFETPEELSAHEAEKQYECTFCGNRFKNKNEAERHQNSLHVRRHSWSCSALHVAGFDKAFHDSPTHPGEADACGYCGDEFRRSGGVMGHVRHPTDQDWDERLRHLQEVHKFRECNSGKKFFRADHFRQHLKHSHAGTSGKWTNMLETACMIDEEPSQPLHLQ